MSDARHSTGLLSRREAIGRAAGGLGVLASFLGHEAIGAVEGEPVEQSGAASSMGLPTIPSWRTELRALAPNVYAYVQAGGPDGYREFIKESRLQYDNLSVSNAGLIVGPNSALVFDALGAPLHAKTFIAAAKEVTGGKPFDRVVHSHHHGDHTNGTQFFMPAEVVSHDFCRKTVAAAAANIKPGTKFAKREAWADGTEDRILVPASTTFSDRQTYYYGDTVVELFFVGPAHTYGDVVAYLPQHRILFGGDVVFHYVTPAVQSGHPSRWIQAMDRLLAMNIDVVVPGHGPLGTKKEMAETREYFAIQGPEARKRFDAGMSPGRAAADIDMGKFEGWTNPDRAAWNLCRWYEEFKGTITPENDQRVQREAVEEYLALRAARRG